MNAHVKRAGEDCTVEVIVLDVGGEIDPCPLPEVTVPFKHFTGREVQEAELSWVRPTLEVVALRGRSEGGLVRQSCAAEEERIEYARAPHHFLKHLLERPVIGKPLLKPLVCTLAVQLAKPLIICEQLLDLLFNFLTELRFRESVAAVLSEILF